MGGVSLGWFPIPTIIYSDLAVRSFQFTALFSEVSLNVHADFQGGKPLGEIGSSKIHIGGFLLLKPKALEASV